MELRRCMCNSPVRGAAWIWVGAIGGAGLGVMSVGKARWKENVRVRLVVDLASMHAGGGCAVL